MKLRSSTCLLLVGLVLGAPFEARAQNRDRDPFSAGAGSPRANRIPTGEFVDAPVTTIFKIISDATGWSIIVSPKVVNAPPKISIWVKDMTADQVLEKITTATGLSVDRKGNVVEVMTVDEYAQRYGVERTVIELKNASASEVANILEQLVDRDRSKVLLHEPGNTIILLAPKVLTESLVTLAETLDTPLAKDKLRVIKLEHLDAETLVPTLEQFLAQGGGVGTRYGGLFTSSPTPPPVKKPAAQLPDQPAQPPAQPQQAGTEGIESQTAGERWVVQFMQEPNLNVVVLRGLPSDVDRTAELIQELDVASEITTVAYQLRFTNGRDVYETIRDLVERERSLQQQQNQAEPRLRVSVSEQNNRIVVEGSPKDHERMAAIIEAIDQPLPAGSGGIRVYRLENASAAEVAQVLQDIIAQGEGLARQGPGTAQGQTGPSYIRPAQPAGPTPASQPRSPSRPATPSGQTPSAESTSPSGGEDQSAGDVLPTTVTIAEGINAVVIQTSASRHEEFAEVIADLDRPRDQVMLEVTLVLVRASDTFDFSVELGGAAVNGRDTDALGFSNFGVANIDPATGNMSLSTPPPFGANFGVFNAGDYSLVINALKTVGKTRIVSAPKIVVQDNAEAEIKQANQEPYTVASQGETSTITSFGGFVDAGTTLTVTPHVSERGWLRLDYQVELSSFGTRTVEQRAANLPPPRQENTSRGTVRLPADYMLVLGGLANTRRDDNQDGIPFLMDVPILGEIFKSRSTANTDETLFIFIRPVVLKDPAFADLLLLSDEDRKRADVAPDEPTNAPKLFVPAHGKMPESGKTRPREESPAPSNGPRFLDPAVVPSEGDME